MSNILIIKHGSLGDIAQASGVIQDISENHKDDDVFILTTKPYLNLVKKNIWSSSLTTLPEGKTKEEFDKLSVLDRFDHQIRTSNLISKHTLYPEFSWACSDITNLKNEYKLKKYILLFPFCSPHLTIKR